METIQYVNLTHTSKGDAKEHKTQAAIGTQYGARFCTVDLSFEDIVEHHRKGMTFRRLPVLDDGRMSTNMLILDLDNDPKNNDGTPDLVNPKPDLLWEELSEMLFRAQLDGEITRSTSGDPYKWHVFIKVPNTITSRAEYDWNIEDAERRLEAAYMELRGLTSSPVLRDRKLTVNSTVFAPCQKETAPIVIGNIMFDPVCGYYSVTPRCHLERTKEHPEPRYCESSEKAESAYRDIPPRWSGLAKMLYREGILERECLEEPGADFNFAGCIHFLRKGKTKESFKIPIGERDYQCNLTMMSLYGQARAYNLWLDQHGLGIHKFTLEDMRHTLSKILSKSYEEGDTFTHEKFLSKLEKTYRQYECISDSEYVNNNGLSWFKRKVSRTHADTADAASRVIVEHQDGDRVVFGSIEEREAVLKERGVSLSSIRRLAKSMGLSLSVVSRAGGNNKGKAGRPTSISLESLSAIGKINGSVFEYSGKLGGNEKKWLQRHGYRIKKLKETHGATTDAGGEQ